MAASDGQKFSDQSEATQNDFKAVYGDNAASAWEAEHDAALGGGGSSSSGGGKASSSGGSSGNDDAIKNLAGNDAATLKQTAKANANLAKFQQGQLANTKAALKAQIQQWKSQTKYQYAELEATKGKYAADAWYQQQEINVALLAHQDDMARIGLDYIKQGVEYASTPDNYFKLLDFQAGAAQRQDVPMFLQALQGTVNAPAFQQSGGSPTAKQPGDVLSLLGFGQGSTAATGFSGVNAQAQPASTVTATGASVPASTMGDAGVTDGRANTNANTETGAGNSVVDPRQAAAMGVLSAVPPSPTAGINGQDASALNTIMDLYSNPSKIAPGAWESTPLAAKKLFLAGVSRGGGDQSLFLDRLTRSGINQGSGNAA